MAIRSEQESKRKPGKAVFLINEILLKNGYELKDDFTFAYERTFLKILSFLIEPRHTKILYILKQIKFSSIWELSKLFQLGYTRDIQRIMDDFEKFGIIQDLNNTDKHYEIIKEFWGIEYPNSRKKRPSKLYYLNDNYIPVIEEFSQTVYKKYIWSNDWVKIQNRQIKYERFLKNKKAELMKIEQAEKDMIGICDACKKPVLESHQYERYGKITIHKTCMKNASTAEIKKWIHSK